MSKTEKLRNAAKIFFFINLQILFSFIFFTMIYRREAPASANADSQENLLVSRVLSKKPIIILLWTFPFGIRFPIYNCPQQLDNSDCLYTADRTQYSSAHAVVFHHRDVCTTKTQLPQTPRPSNQRWVWFNQESPSYSPNLALMNNLMNLTITYRLDSDIFAPYGWLEKHNTTMNFTIPKKTKLAAWAISNWNPISRRVKYYGELKNHLQVDIYGKQHQKLPKDKKIETLSTYKFYFAFENSIHEDYITEKLWYNALYSGCVPVVMGPPRENYERFIPRDAFIHVDDFASPQELASYLLSLDKDEEKYKQYFNWRSQYYVPPQDNPWTVPYCRVCKALKDPPPYRTIASIEKWYKNEYWVIDERNVGLPLI
ncbi:3-galactosyl-N-acetylglucosaminide 4-alpha-L-fucosyltransferase FUT3-like [Engystomops pustulosus]|uniref:3-galactosyl-N-acetylglucosaminide 4-alpha-L-fucosyltransferase FUT3-like n=1 Tax=Engystomops pustulosus TaxID=76066 RepID=UPI003AFA770A